MKWILTLALFFAIKVTFAQNLEKELLDTIDFVIQEVRLLENETYTYNAYRLNFDNCNLEVEQSIIGDSTKWNLLAFWMMDLDESEMRLLEQPNGEWGLVLNTNSARWKIKYDSESDSGRRNFIILVSEEREQLVSLGQALFFAIKKCKELERVSDY